MENVSHWVAAGSSQIAHCGSVIWPPGDFCALWTSQILVTGEQLFHVIVTQLIIGLGPYFMVCEGDRCGRHREPRAHTSAVSTPGIFCTFRMHLTISDILYLMT